ncbi:HD domain-containing phosphohydrolase [Fusibacter bizertensis]|uniref:HD domain-containing phosphohydrolase n=1 Tax=Fusibacter bizertensis TaxID=1488331 RepID=A0ABT6N9T4_9FIRM|nr:HD domain-containing phosphohydrolase [Fusibacter bizertensis]MDH8677181.1 HD domain-containing phosphohydrolase [Fusibacter bizertensis]
MKTIRGKLLLIFMLVFVALFVTTASAYVAVETQKQHLILTELLSKQKLLVERVTFTAINMGEIAIYDKDRFQKLKSDNEAQLKEYEGAVDFMLNAFSIKEYPIDGKIVKLKFSQDFSKILDDALAVSFSKWSDAKAQINWLLDVSNLSDIALYTEKLDTFKVTNVTLIESADYITQICRSEANAKKQLSEILQIISLFAAGFIFIALIFIIRKSIHAPIIKIQSALFAIGNGDYSERLNRTQEDEFKALYEDFNRAMDSIEAVKDIENRILGENDILEILDFMQSSFKPFVEIKEITLFYENITDGAIKLSNISREFEMLEKISIPDQVMQENEYTLILPIAVNKAVIGYARFESSNKLTERHVNFLMGLKEKISFALFKTILFKDLLGIVTGSLADLAEGRDPETRRHLTRMSMYAQIISKTLQKKDKYKNEIDKEFVNNIILTSPMHDIGKISVPDSILLKPGKLTDEEFMEMKKHAFYGAKFLSKIHERFSKYGFDYFQMAEHIAHYHQEKYNGSGYPDGIIGNEIPLSARISALADVFDALTSKRPYKEAFSLEKSYEIINKSIGSHFDPEIVAAFFEAQEEIEAVYEAYKEI